MPRNNKPRATCHPTRAHEAHGLCRRCYRKRPENLRKVQIYSREYRAKYPEKVKRAQKDYFLQRLYDITLIEYEILLEGQDYRCAICHIPAASLTRQLAVDHNHTTGCVRGLLCGYCNTAIGQIERVGVEHIDHMKAYLQRGK